MKARDVAARIARAFPDLWLHTLQPLGEGWANATWLVNGDVVFRFPKREQAAQAILREMAVLPGLAQSLPVAVPDYRYAVPHGTLDDARPFGGYGLVPGTPMCDLPRSVDVASTAASVGRFLTALHEVPLAYAVAAGVPGGSGKQWRDGYVAWCATVRRYSAPVLTGPEQRTVAATFDRFLGDDDHFTFTPVLLHRDLSEDHLMIDADRGTLTGVIDFEDMSIGDPAFDFTGLDCLGDPVYATYNGPVDDGFAERIRFYRWLLPLHELYYGVESGLPEYVQRGVARLRRALDDA